MKKKSETSIFDDLNDSFVYTKLYKEDLEDVLELAADKSLKATISDEKYEYENLDEVIEQKGTLINSLTIEIESAESQFKKLVVSVKAHEITLRSSKTDNLIPVYVRVKEIISKRSSWRYKLIRPWLYFYSLMALCWLRPLNSNIEALPAVSAKINIALYGVLISLALYSFTFKKYYRGIHLKKEHEVTNFFQRNSDKLIFTVIGFFLGIASKVITEKIF